MIVDSLRALLDGSGESQVGLWGGVGKTHLLNACADYARGRSPRLQLFDARQLVEFDAAQIGEFDNGEVLAIDNLDAVAGRPDWESLFYAVANRCRDGRLRFVYTLAERPDRVAFALDDLRSRLQWGLLLQLPAIGEAELGSVLRRRARLLGFDLPADVVRHLLSRYPRDLAAQMELLRRLDAASLAERRRVTLPLVRRLLG